MARVRALPCPDVRAARTWLNRGSRALGWAFYVTPGTAYLHPQSRNLTWLPPPVLHRKGDGRTGAAPGHCDDARLQTYVDDCDRFRTYGPVRGTRSCCPQGFRATGRGGVRVVFALVLDNG